MGDKQPKRDPVDRLIKLVGSDPAKPLSGAGDALSLALAEINGRSVDSVADADEAFRHPIGEFHRLKFYRDDLRREVVLDAAGFEESTARILENYDIPARIRIRPPGRERVTVECEPQAPEYR